MVYGCPIPGAAGYLETMNTTQKTVPITHWVAESWEVCGISAPIPGRARSAATRRRSSSARSLPLAKHNSSLMEPSALSGLGLLA